MRFVFIWCAFFLGITPLLAQTTKPVFFEQKIITPTAVKNQAASGTCWCFSALAVLESECLRQNLGEFDLSEAYLVRNTYLEKARNYVRRQGFAR